MGFFNNVEKAMENIAKRKMAKIEKEKREEAALKYTYISNDDIALEILKYLKKDNLITGEQYNKYCELSKGLYTIPNSQGYRFNPDPNWYFEELCKELQLTNVKLIKDRGYRHSELLLSDNSTIGHKIQASGDHYYTLYTDYSSALREAADKLKQKRKNGLAKIEAFKEKHKEELDFYAQVHAADKVAAELSSMQYNYDNDYLRLDISILEDIVKKVEQ